MTLPTASESVVELTSVVLVKAMTLEYIQHKGYISCEFSVKIVSPNFIAELHNANAQLAAANLVGRWHLYSCSTCSEHSNGLSPIHVEIGGDYK